MAPSAAQVQHDCRETKLLQSLIEHICVNTDNLHTHVCDTVCLCHSVNASLVKTPCWAAELHILLQVAVNLEILARCLESAWPLLMLVRLLLGQFKSWPIA